MRELTAQLESDLALSATIAHNATSGLARERVIHERLQPYLPSRFATASGTALNTAGARSAQLDLMIVDETAGKPFVNVGGESVVPIELIHGCVQVKTGVAPSNLGDAVDNVASLLQLYEPLDRREAPDDGWARGDRPVSAILAYSSTKDERNLFEAFVEANLRRPPGEQVEFLLVIGQFLVHMSACIEQSDTHPYGLYAPAPRLDADSWSTSSDGADATLAFYVLVSAALAGYRPPAFSPWEYARTAGLLRGGRTLYWSREGDPEELVRRREERKAS